jgi:hypothetical protein
MGFAIDDLLFPPDACGVSLYIQLAVKNTDRRRQPGGRLLFRRGPAIAQIYRRRGPDNRSAGADLRPNAREMMGLSMGQRVSVFIYC